MRVAAILLNYNSAEDCRKCVACLKRQEDVELEIVIVDNASKAEDAEAVRRLCEAEGLTFIPAGENRGYNAGNNVGLRYAARQGYQYALIANPDMEFPDRRYVRRLADELSADPCCVAVGSDIVTPEGVHQNPMVADGSWTTSFGWVKEIIGRKRAHDAWSFIDNYKESHACAKLSGCALMVNVQLIEKIGLFDEYPFLYCEEAIFAKQAESAGLRMLYVADVQAVHRHISSAKGDPRPRFRQWKRSRLYFIRRYAGYPWYGRLLSSLSWRAYMNLMITKSTVSKWLQK